MKKKLLLLHIALYIFHSSFAQNVGIGTATPHISAMLDVSSTNRGMLVPRMTTVQRTAITTPAQGLLVYDTDTNTFWFYNASAWTNLSVSASGGVWSLTGNSGTDTAIHFIGTTDNQPLRFKINNTWAGELHPATGNVFMGLRAGQSNTTASGSVAIGSDALKSSTTRSGIVAIGNGALYNNGIIPSFIPPNIDPILAINNTGVGAQALYSNTYGYANTALGSNALYSNAGGSENTAMGTNSLYYNVGTKNTATGSRSLFSNSTGTENTAIGSAALYSNTTAGYNTAAGSSALYSNTTASNNTALGYAALYAQSYANGGTAWASGNVAVGYSALSSNQPTSTSNGISNTAVGTSAMDANVTGFDNTALGAAALYTSVTGNENTAIGRQALFYSYNGNGNTATGYKALRSNGNGNTNTANGNFSLFSNTSGGSNTAVGYNALYNMVSGYGNTAVGVGSGTHQNTTNLGNTISIGNNGYLNAASNQAFFGNLNTVWNGGNMPWSTYSDARLKNNIAEDVKGLDFIIRLRPVTYYRSIKAMTKITGNKEVENYPGKYDVEKIKYTGFLAHEVEQAAKDAGYNFSGITIPRNANELYTLSYEQFVVPLVKAVQEQQVIIEELKNEKTNQLKEIDELKARLDRLEATRKAIN